MNIVQILFPAKYRDALLSGHELSTARTKQLGAGGDRFQAFGEWFDILSVEEIPLDDIEMSIYIHRFKKVRKGE